MATKNLTNSEKAVQRANESLPASIKDSGYEVINWAGGIKQYFGTSRLIDLEQLTTRDADYLVLKNKMRKNEPKGKTSSEKK